jgi:hypothetical protein
MHHSMHHSTNHSMHHSTYHSMHRSIITVCITVSSICKWALTWVLLALALTHPMGPPWAHVRPTPRPFLCLLVVIYGLIDPSNTTLQIAIRPCKTRISTCTCMWKSRLPLVRRVASLELRRASPWSLLHWHWPPLHAPYGNLPAASLLQPGSSPARRCRASSRSPSTERGTCCRPCL